MVCGVTRLSNLALRRLSHKMLEGGIQHMMPPPHPGTGIVEQLARRPKPLPFPGLARLGPFTLQSFGQPHPRKSHGSILRTRSISLRSQSTLPKSCRPNGGSPCTDDPSHSFRWRNNHFLALEGDTGSIFQKVSAETRFISDF